MARVVSGRRIGRVIEPALRRAGRRLWVATPFLSPEYARLLVEKAGAGVDVRLVTSDSPENREALRILRRSRLRSRLARGAAAALAVAGLLPPMLLGGEWPWLASALAAGLALYVVRRLLPLASALVVAGLWLLARRLWGPGSCRISVVGACYYAASLALLAMALRLGWGGGVRVRVVGRDRFLVHSKIIIVDDEAIVGSANLTRTALWRNHETVTIYEPGESGEAVEAFERLWREA